MVSLASPKSILYLGSGNFESPLKAAKEIASRYATATSTLPNDIRFVATELRTREETKQACYNLAAKAGGRGKKKLKIAPEESTTLAFILQNIKAIEDLGGQVVEGFDALKPFDEKLQNPMFDRIIFENPHSGYYGQGDFSDKKEYNPDAHPDPNGRSIRTNTGLLIDVMRNLRNHLTPSGIFELSICGWPFMNPGIRGDGMDLLGQDKNGKLNAVTFAAGMGMEYLGNEFKGEQIISRNNGEEFTAKVYTLRFKNKAQSSQIGEGGKSAEGSRERPSKL